VTNPYPVKAMAAANKMSDAIVILRCSLGSDLRIASPIWSAAPKTMLERTALTIWKLLTPARYHSSAVTGTRSLMIGGAARAGLKNPAMGMPAPPEGFVLQ
jgi:hypothetical protein